MSPIVAGRGSWHQSRGISPLALEQDRLGQGCAWDTGGASGWWLFAARMGRTTRKMARGACSIHAHITTGS